MRIQEDYNAAMRDLFLYGSCVLRITCGPDKPRHIFAGRNDMETTMTKPKFDVHSPLPGSDDAPIITAEQMSRFLYSHIGSGDGKKIAEVLNGCNTPDYYGALQVTYVEPQKVFHGFTIGQTIYAKAADGYRMFAVSTVDDDQKGCDTWNVPHIAIKGDDGSRGIVAVSDFSATPPEPTHVFGLKIGGIYYLKDQDKYGGSFKGKPIKVLGDYAKQNRSMTMSNKNRVWTDGSCWQLAEDLTPTLPTLKEYIEGFEVGSTVYYCGAESRNRDWCGEPIRIVKGDWLRGEMISQPGRYGAFLPKELTEDITKATKRTQTSIGGFNFGATVYSTDNSAWTGPMIVAPADQQLRDNFGHIRCIHPRYGHGNFRGQGLTTDETKGKGYEPPKPKRLPIERPVRMKDVRPGDILRYCGVEDDHAGWPKVGSEVVVGGRTLGGRSLYYRCTNKSGTVVNSQHAPDYCVAQGFSFVRRPFKAGEAVRYKASATKALGWEGALLVDTNEADRPNAYGIAVINHKGVHGSISASDLERIL